MSTHHGMRVPEHVLLKVVWTLLLKANRGGGCQDTGSHPLGSGMQRLMRTCGGTTPPVLSA